MTSFDREKYSLSNGSSSFTIFSKARFKVLKLCKRWVGWVRKRAGTDVQWSLRDFREELTTPLSRSHAQAKTEISLSWKVDFSAFLIRILILESCSKRISSLCLKKLPFPKNQSCSFSSFWDPAIVGPSDNSFGMLLYSQVLDFWEMGLNSRKTPIKKFSKNWDE